jgi:Xaa-Pro aminopeptidase
MVVATRSTKDAAEVERIREMGRRTTEVFRLTVEFLKAHAVKGEALVQANGSPLTIGIVHKDILQPGHIFTCEPGLYYPEKGFGVRIEDVIYIDPSGIIYDLTAFPKELVVKM